MKYAVDVEQLLNLWTVIRILGEIRELPDETCRSDVLTEAQILLTAFVLGLKPLARDQADSIGPRTRPNEMKRFDA